MNWELVVTVIFTLTMWIGISTIILIMQLGNKNKPDPWWMGLALSGVWPIVWLIVVINWIRTKFK